MAVVGADAAAAPHPPRLLRLRLGEHIRYVSSEALCAFPNGMLSKLDDPQWFPYRDTDGTTIIVDERIEYFDDVLEFCRRPSRSPPTCPYNQRRDAAFAHWTGFAMTYDADAEQQQQQPEPEWADLMAPPTIMVPAGMQPTVTRSWITARSYDSGTSLRLPNTSECIVRGVIVFTENPEILQVRSVTWTPFRVVFARDPSGSGMYTMRSHFFNTWPTFACGASNNKTGPALEFVLVNGSTTSLSFCVCFILTPRLAHEKQVRDRTTK